MLHLLYIDHTSNLYINLGSILTNHSMSIEDAMELLDVDMDKITDELGWDGWDYDDLYLLDDETADELAEGREEITL